MVGFAATKTDKYHRAASYLSRSQLAKGKAFYIRGGDGTKNILLQVKGSVDGKKGIFEYIVNRNGTISYQLFKVGGIINGKEN